MSATTGFDLKKFLLLTALVSALSMPSAASAQAPHEGVSAPAAGGASSSVWDGGAGGYQGTNSQQESDDSYVIGPNNLIFIKIMGEGGLPTTFRIDDMGFINHPLVGRVQLGGLTPSQAEQRLADKLRGDYILDPHVTVFVLEHSHFSVLGEVRKPGTYEIVGRVSVVEAISMAGGFTPVAAVNKVRILRQGEGGEQTVIVNVKDIMEGKKEAGAYVQAGDVIHVTKSFF